ncbi:hypothetical protein OP10G_3464 [Fimbriimonas ginsengisoli Gsoil 348]|uniref:Uncharacterized protein n=2 Tax=Fimbriimonas ginsengisoli TaxID=1005039 RepID=A0A068NTY6_FIMGI|nr:hypothetical protein OP10G_3464 [Fimbriimonas ginsengisoli Gsoil 348]
MHKKWQALPAAKLRWAADVSEVFTRKALAYFLPAFIVLYLRRAKPIDEDQIFNFGRWIGRLFPLSELGYSKSQILLLRNLLVWTDSFWDAKKLAPGQFQEWLDLLDLDLDEGVDHPPGRDFHQEGLQLIERIKVAFQGVSRAGGASWAGTEIEDNYGSVYGKPIYHDRDQNWEQLVDDSAWLTFPGVGGCSFLDRIGFRYYLPAALVRTIRDGEDADILFHLTLRTEQTDYTLDQWSALDEEQVSTVRAVLEYMYALKLRGREEWVPEPRDVAKWRTALESYWRNPFPIPRTGKPITGSRVKPQELHE